MLNFDTACVLQCFSFSSITERFNVGQATAIRAVRRVSKAICELSPKYIVWPTKNKISEIVDGFSEIGGFPDVIGAIDSIFVNIPAPKANAQAFVNRKGRYSIHLQVLLIYILHAINCIIYCKFS